MTRKIKANCKEGAGAEVLLLGEANFSFALALLGLLLPPAKPAKRPGQQPGQKEQDELWEQALKERLGIVASYLQLPSEACKSLRLTATCYESHPEPWLHWNFL